MKVALLSDLHFEYRENRVLWPHIVRRVRDDGADVVLVGGDIDQDDDRLAGWLADLRRLGPRVLYVPGNHELQTDDRGRPGDRSITRYRSILRSVCDSADAVYLPHAAPFVLDDVAFVGVPGWCDGSLAGEPWPDDEIVKGDQWTPAVPDRTLADRFRHELEDQIRELDVLRRFRSIASVVALFHFVPSRRALVALEKARGRRIDRGTAGASMLSILTGRIDDLVLAAHGHRHVPYAARVNDVLVLAQPLGRPDQVGTARPPSAAGIAALAGNSVAVVTVDTRRREARVLRARPRTAAPGPGRA